MSEAPSSLPQHHRVLLRACRLLLMVPVLLGAAAAACARAAAAPVADDPVARAHAAYQQRDRARLAQWRQLALGRAHPLAMWADYWDLQARLPLAGNDEVEAFLRRWPGTYVEDRLRGEWIVELGKRRDWARVAAHGARLRVAQARETACYLLLVRHQRGEDVTGPARAEWFAQREADHGCADLATALYRAGRFTSADVWARARIAAEQNRRFVAQHAVGLLDPGLAPSVRQVFLRPSAYLSQRPLRPTDAEVELAVLAVIRLAAHRPQAAAAVLQDRRYARWSADGLATAWAAVGKQAAQDAHPQALEWFIRSVSVPGVTRRDVTDDTLEWQVRAALRDEAASKRWLMIINAVDAMSPARRDDPAWMYWKARALKAVAPAGTEGDVQRRMAAALFEQVSGRLHFYSKPAADQIGRAVPVPPRPQPLSPAERAAAAGHAGLTRALALLELRLRGPADDEWNHAINGMPDRALLAAAQRACDAQVWSRCMRTSERTRAEIDLHQRFPTPFLEHVEPAARDADIDMAYVYGVMRQESAFNAGVRSAAGASGLMQLMPQTARWTARKFGIPYHPQFITDPGTNVRLGVSYLKHVLDGFGGSQALAAAAYNAGPNRPRRWLNGVVSDGAAWIELIPLSETRDYVKRVLANAAVYGALMAGRHTVPAPAAAAAAPALVAGEVDAAQLQSAPTGVQPVPVR